MSELVSKMIEKADLMLSDADYLMENGRTLSATSRYYYAMFYAAEAVLISIGVEARSHKAVITMFGKHLVKDGKFDPSIGKKLHNSYTKRLFADYDPYFDVTLKDASSSKDHAHQFVATIKTYLQIL